MRVVDMTQWYSPTSGGIRTYLRTKAEWASRHGMEHAAIITGLTSGVEAVASSPFVRVRGRTPDPEWGYRVALRPYQVFKVLDRLEPDVIVLHDALAFPHTTARWAAKRGAAVVMVCHSDLARAAACIPTVLRIPCTAILGHWQRRALKAPQVLLVASRCSREWVLRHARAPVVISPLGVDLSGFAEAKPDPALRARLAPNGELLLLYVGRISSDKRVELLPEMLTYIEEPAVLVIAGTGAAEVRVKRVAAEQGVEDRTILLGQIDDRALVATLMATADCFVHPNPEEPFGLTPLEALAAGCRVVAPDSAGPAETLTGRGAVLVPPSGRLPTPEDARTLAEGVKRALAGPRPQADLSDFDWDRTFTREWELYEQLAAAPA